MKHAEVTQTRVQLVRDGKSLPGLHDAFAAWCPDIACALPSGVRWHGQSHVVGYESAPLSAAWDDADGHDRKSHDSQEERA